MKVLLLNPPASKGVRMVREGRCMQREGAWTAIWPPISLATIAALLEREGFEVQVLDAVVEEVDFENLAGILKREKPDLLIINTTTPSIESDLFCADLAKKVSPKVVTVAFGIHVSALPEESLALASGLDAVVRGEPELALLALVQRVKAKRSFAGVAGLTWRQGKKTVKEKDRQPIKNLNFLPFPAWEKISTHKHRLPFSHRPFLLVNTGRGCSYACRFCAAASFYGQKGRWPTAKRVVDEMENNLKKHRVKDFLFWSESFTMNKKFSQEVCQEILRRRLPVRWVCNSRVDTVDVDQLKLFKKAGGWMIGFGIESGDDRILRLMKKEMTVAKIKKAVRMAKKAGLQVTGHLILGFPGETEATIRKTVDLAVELNLDFAQFYTCVPFPGSALYQEAKEKGYLTTADWSRFEQNFSVMDLPGLPAEKVERLRGWAYRRFYFRPKMIGRTLRRLKSPADFWFFLKMTRDFLGWS